MYQHLRVLANLFRVSNYYSGWLWINLYLVSTHSVLIDLLKNF